MRPPSADGETLTTRVWAYDRSRRKALTRVSTAALFAGVPLVVLYQFAAVPIVPLNVLGGALLAFAVLVAGIGALLGNTDAGGPGSATLRADGITLRYPFCERSLSRDELRDGMVLWDMGGWMLELRTRDEQTYRLDMPDEATARRWLDALGLAAAARALTLVSDRRGLQALTGYFMTYPAMLPFAVLTGLMRAILEGAGVAMRDGLGSVFPFLLIAVGFWTAFRTVGHVELTIGVDGVRFSRGVQTHFLKLDEIEQVDTDGDTELRFHLRGARAPIVFKLATAALRQAAMARVEEVRALRRGSTAPEPVGRLATHGMFTAEAWRDAFLGAVREGSYRGVSLTLDELERVIDAPAVTVEQRVGAALALRALAPVEASTRVRAAVERIADPSAEAMIDRAVERETRAKG